MGLKLGLSCCGIVVCSEVSNNMLTVIFEPFEEEGGECFHNDELHNLYFARDILG